MWNVSQISSWIIAVGTVISAIGSTPSQVLSNAMLRDLNIIGDALQAVGSGIIPTDADPLDKVGSQLGAIGNLITLESFFIEDQNTSSLISAQGDFVQALGGVLTIDYSGNQSIEDALNNIGNVLQVIGTIYQALSIKYPSNSQKAQEMNTVGSWIQAVGAVLSALTVDE